MSRSSSSDAVTCARASPRRPRVSRSSSPSSCSSRPRSSDSATNRCWAPSCRLRSRPDAPTALRAAAAPRDFLELVDPGAQIRLQACVLERDAGRGGHGVEELGLVEERRIVQQRRDRCTVAVDLGRPLRPVVGRRQLHGPAVEVGVASKSGSQYAQLEVTGRGALAPARRGDCSATGGAGAPAAGRRPTPVGGARRARRRGTPAAPAQCDEGRPPDRLERVAALDKPERAGEEEERQHHEDQRERVDHQGERADRACGLRCGAAQGGSRNEMV